MKKLAKQAATPEKSTLLNYKIQGAIMQNHHIPVTVGLFVYNSAEFLREAIEGIYSQNYPIEELIISDDASTDNSWEIIHATIKRLDSNNHLIRNCIIRRNENNLGLIHHVNLVVEMASHELFIGHAGDDISEPNRIEEISKDFLKQGCPRHYLCHSNVSIIGHDHILIPPVIALGQTLEDMAVSTALHIGASQAFTTHLAHDFGPIVFNTYEDLTLGFRAALAGNYHHIPKPLVQYRLGGISSPGRTDAEQLRQLGCQTLLQRASDCMQVGRLDLLPLISAAYGSIAQQGNHSHALVALRQLNDDHLPADRTPPQPRPPQLDAGHAPKALDNPPRASSAELTVAVGLITYNQQAYIEEAILSILQQSRQVDQLVVCDDCSTDDTWVTIVNTLDRQRQLGTPLPIIVLQRNESNLGYLANFQQAVKLSNADLFVYQAGDDVALPNRVARLADAYVLAGCPSYFLAHSSVYRDLMDAEHRWAPPAAQLHTDKDVALATSLHIGATEAFTPALLTEWGDITESTFDDLILGFRAQLFGAYICIDEPLLLYRTGGMTSSLLQVDDFDNARRHHIGTLTQRWRDATRLGRVDMSRALAEELESLGAVAPASDPSLQPAGAATTPPNSASASQQNSCKPPRVLLISAEPVGSRYAMTRTARLSVLLNAGSVSALRTWAPDKANPENASELVGLLTEVDLVWVFQTPFDLDTQNSLTVLLESNRFMVWESCRRLDEVSLRTKPTPGDCVREKFSKVLLRRASLIITASPRLAAVYQAKTQSPVITVPDHLPEAWWSAHGNSVGAATQASDVLHVGAVTYSTSESELKLLADTVLQLSHRWPGRLRFTIFGPVPSVLRQHPGVRIDQMPMRYHQMRTRLASDPVHLALMPLLSGQDHEFEGRASWLEWAAIGVPVLASDVGIFDDLATRGLMRLARNLSSDWCNAALELLQSPGMANGIAQRASAFVKAESLLERQHPQWLALINQGLPAKLQIPPLTLQEVAALPVPSDEEWLFEGTEYRRWLARSALREIDGETLAERIVAWQASPSALMISLVSQPQLALLPVTALSLQHQLHKDWRWVILSDLPPVDEDFMASDTIGWLQIPSLQDTEAVTQMIQGVCAELQPLAWTALTPGAHLRQSATIEVLDAFVTQPHAQAVYTDHDHWDDSVATADALADVDHVHNRKCQPVFKPDFDIHWFRQTDYIGPTLWFRTASMDNLGGLLPLPDAWSYELCLRAWEADPAAIHHLASIAVSLPKTVTNSRSAQSPVHARQVAVEFHLQRVQPGVPITIAPGLKAGAIQLQPALPPETRLSVVLVIRNDHYQAQESLKGLLAQNLPAQTQLVLIANRITDPDLKKWLRTLPQRHPGLQVLHDEGEYNLARLYNVGAQHGTGHWLLFCSADVIWVESLSVQRLIASALLPGVALAGPLLLTPETGAVDSAGLVPAQTDHWPVAKPDGQDLGLFDAGPWGNLCVIRRVPGLENVAVLMAAPTWNMLSGFDEALHAVAFVSDAGLRASGLDLGDTVFTPFARAVHARDAMASRQPRDDQSRLLEATQRQAQAGAYWLRHQNQWASHPAHSLHLSLRSSRLRLDDVAPIRWPLKHSMRPKTLAYASPGASGEYRVKAPMQTLVKTGCQFTEVLDVQHSPLLSAAELMRLQPDHVLLHQVFGTNFEQAICNWKRVAPDLRVIFGMDDRSDAVPEKNDSFELFRRMHPDARDKARRMAQLADTVVVSTKPLADMVRDLGVSTPVFVVPNTLERERWANCTPPRYSRRKPRVGWVGAMQHRGDLELLLPVIQRTRHAVDWVFMGMSLPDAAQDIKEIHRGVAFHLYPQEMAKLDLDLALAPLEMNAFNEAKSNLRLLEYGALGYPVICTDITPYREHSPPVTRLRNVPDLWTQAILEAVSDIDKLRARGEKLKKWVYSRYMAEHHIGAWQQAIVGRK